MNQKLQNIFDIIQQSDKLDADQRNNLLKAVKDADKELEITAFKLERTEKVKKTTAILLEETIQELEQKRKAVEAQNRELEIEAALEKVRAVAMGMGKRADMLEICRTISLQLHTLGLTEIRNVQTAIFYKERGTYLNYEYYARHYKTIFTETTYSNNKVHHEFAIKMMRGKGEFFRTHITDLKAWLAYQKTTNVFIDTYLETAASLSYYWFSLGPVALGISTYIPLEDLELQLFNRFLSVFELAYRRFTDIEQAEAQAREARIEAALERVRARTMAMHNSTELSETASILFHELKKLDIDSVRSGVCIIDYKKDSAELWLSTEISGKTETRIVTTVHADLHPMYKEWFEAGRQKQPYYIKEMGGKELVEYYETVSDQLHLPVRESHNEQEAFHGFFFEEGTLNVISLKRLSEDDCIVMQRFARVFGLMYRRFLDLKKAEAQAREAQIEAALERVRSRTVAMHKSEELVEASDVLFTEIEKLGIDAIRTGVALIDGQKNTVEVWSRSEIRNRPENRILGVVPASAHPMYKGIIKAWKEKKPYYSYTLKGKHLINYYEKMSSYLSYPVRKKFNERETIATYFFAEGSLNVISLEPLNSEQNDLIIRFARVFGQLYRRFLDLQKAEAQARESRIEAALERVRAKTMAMHQSDELAETAAVLFKQLIDLGIEPNRIYIGIIKDNNGTGEFWITDEDGSKVSTGFTANLNENASFQKMYNGWAEQKASIIIDMRGRELQEYFQHLNKLGVPFKGGLSQKRRMQYIAYFSNGFIGVASPDETKPETLQLLERFAAVFNLTYTRFNDLLQAEAQNKIIQAENERKTSELEEARQLQLAMLPKEVPQLPHLDIAVYMKTATEVGGDYYDFSIREDGSLNICLGDATGHGMKAGIMVSSMKSIFTTNAAKMDLENFFTTANSGIKSMNLKRMMMGLTMLTINHNQFRMINAGMPPVYLYRKKSDSVEEFREHGLPIGAMKQSRYTVLGSKLDKDDILLLLTDGMPELQNSKHELYGYTRLQSRFKQLAGKNSEEIVKQLNKTATLWTGEKDPEDDISFVVIKLK